MFLLQNLGKPLFIRNFTCFVSKSVLKTKEQSGNNAFHFLSCPIWVNMSFLRRLLCFWSNTWLMKVTFYSPCFSSIFNFIYSIITYSFIKNCRWCWLACLGDIRFPSGLTSQFLNRSKQDLSFQGLITTLQLIYLLHFHFYFQKKLYHLQNKI